MKTAKEYLEEKGINPIEPIFWETGTKYLTISDVMEEYASIYANAKLDEALLNSYEIDDEVPFKVVDKSLIKSLKDKF